MMKAFDGFKSEASKRVYQLPAGPYIAKIMAVKIDGVEPDQTLILRLDVAEGDYAGYYAKRYDSESQRKNATYKAKYKGDFRLRIPNPDNKKALHPESDLRNFNDAIYRIEQSNPGYHWDWNEKGLAGLMIGINVQQGTYNGSQFTKIAKLEIVDEIRRGLVKPLAPMEPRSDSSAQRINPEPPVYQPPVTQQVGYQETMNSGFTTVVDTSDLPF